MIGEETKLKEELKRSDSHIIRASEKKETNELFQKNFPEPNNGRFQNERFHQVRTIKMTYTTMQNVKFQNTGLWKNISHIKNQDSDGLRLPNSNTGS